MEPKTVVVLAMARSGTSVAAGILQILGVHMGDRFKAARGGGESPETVFASEPPYPCSFFEDLAFDSLIRRIFKTALPGSPNFRPPSGLQIAAAGRVHDHEVRKLVRQKQAAHEVWGWKVPQTALVFSLFAPYLTNPHLVIVHRNRNDHALSFLAWNQTVTIEESFDLVDYYRAEIERVLNKYPRIPYTMVDYWDIRDRPIAAARCLAEFLDLEMSFKKREIVKAFVKPRLSAKYKITSIARLGTSGAQRVYHYHPRE